MPTVTQKFDYDLSLWRPAIKRITDSPLWAGVSQGRGESIVSIPVTSEAISRTQGKAAYLHNPFQETVDLVFGNFREDFLQTIGQFISGEKRPRVVSFVSSKNYSVGDLVSFSGLQSDPTNFSIRILWDHVAEQKNYGIFGKTVTSQEPYHMDSYEMPVNGLQKDVTIQDAWIISGITGHPTYAPIDRCWLTRTYESDYSGTLETQIVAEIAGPILERQFPAAVVIESDSYKDHLLFVGGFSAYPGTIETGAYLFDTQGRMLAAGNAPYQVARSAAVFNKKYGVALITGGATTSGAFTTHEGAIYNPATGIWTLMTGTLVTPRRDHQMISLGEEDVLVVGGRTGIMDTAGHPDLDPMGVILNKCEIITMDGAVNSAAPRATGSMSFARTAFGMTKLPDGRVLVVGGIGYNPGYPYLPYATDYEEESEEYLGELKSCEIYDPESGFWSPIAPMIKAHSYCACAYIAKQNKVYVYGGFSFDGTSTLDTTIAEYLDLDTMTWHVSSVNVPKVIAYASPAKVCNSLIILPGGGEIATMDDPLTYTVSGYNGLWASPRYGSINSWEVGVECNRPDGVNGYEFKVINVTPGDPGEYNILATSPYLGKNDNGAESYCVVEKISGAGENSESCGATATDDIKGPFSYDLTQAFGIGDSIALSQDLQEGYSYSSIEVTPGDVTVNKEDYIVINYGFESQTPPIKVFGVYGASTLRIDPGYKFTKSISSGAKIYVLSARAAYEAAQSKNLGNFWLTASNAAKQSAKDIIESISATGIDLNFVVRYPGDRGLGNEGSPQSGDLRLSEIVLVYGNDDLDSELEELRDAE